MKYKFSGINLFRYVVVKIEHSPLTKNKLKKTLQNLKINHVNSDADNFKLEIDIQPEYGTETRWNIHVETFFADLLKTINNVGSELSKVDKNLSAKQLRPIVKKAIINSLNYGPKGTIDKYGWPSDWN